jgi:homoserine dehydrogenase
MPVRFADAQVEGITRLQGLDVACAEQLGFRIKLLGVARRRHDGDGDGNGNGDGKGNAKGVELRVQPALLPATHLMAQVNGSMNAVMVKGDAAGVTMFYGAGAGSEQTASAVIADLVDVARLAGTHAAQRVPHLGFHAHAVDEQLAVLPRAAVHTRHYLRVPVHSAQQIEAVAAWLAAQQLPVARVELACQKALPASTGPQVLVLTEPVSQATVDLAVHALAAHPAVAGAVVTLRVEMLEG